MLFKVVSSPSLILFYQVGNLSLGTIPRSIWAVLEEDLVDSCKPGDDVSLLGVVCRRWHAMGK